MVRLFGRFRRKEAAPEAADQAEAAAANEAAAEEQAELEEEYERTVRATRRGMLGRLSGLLRRAEVDEDFWEELEETLILGDVGGATSARLVEDVRDDVGKADADAIRDALRARLVALLESPPSRGALWGGGNGSAGGAADGQPQIVLVVGVNGAGKTTSIAKLAHAYIREGRSVVLAAGDTFRAAAIDQLQVWGGRVGAEVIAHQPGSDPGAVAYDAIDAARSRGVDVVLIDTAGRLQTQRNLMAELGKVRRVIERQCPGAPHEVLLVLDATSGQNALIQARQFSEATGVTGVCLAKLDGTSKGGIVFAIADELKIPVRFAGTGERAEDIAPFDAAVFVDALLAAD